jgi:FkbM family methyltransferase
MPAARTPVMDISAPAGRFDASIHWRLAARRLQCHPAPRDGPAARVALPQDTAPARTLAARRGRRACGDCAALPKVAGAGSVLADADGERVQVMHNGLRMIADGYCGAWMTRLIARCQGHHEPQEERVFHAIVTRLPEDATMLELGGWWSFYTLWFLQNHPRRRGFVLEPDPVHRALGEANARRNGLSPDFITGFAGAARSPPVPFMTESGERVTIPRRSVPSIIAEHGLERLDLLHCDAQGAEFAVLCGCADAFRAGRIRFAMISTHHWSISGDPLTHQRCLEMIVHCGGRIIAEHDVHESFSGDGLIAGCFGAEPLDWAPVPVSRNRYSTSLFRNPLYDLAEERRAKKTPA